jgi:3-dehydroquinate synthase
MVALLVSKKIVIQSHKGEYTARFIRGGIDQLNINLIEAAVYIIDSNICKLYADRLDKVLSSHRVIKIYASEENKSLNKMPEYVDQLVSLNIKRGELLIAIGGGIIQDITCFLATTLMRGLPWIFYPTTLLAQSDSCIGSKSSINSGNFKNILGTFLPPQKIIIDVDFLQTLSQREIFSGLGEMLKVHAINNPKSFDLISEAYGKIVDDLVVMEEFIYRSLSMKKKLIELDEFDQGPRNVMNYGHSFGHAIESATNYSIPHGIAVTIGMDIANFVAAELNITSTSHFERMHRVINENCKTYRHVNISVDLLLNALSKDKKNSSTQLRLILPDKNGFICIGLYDNNERLKNSIDKYFKTFSIDN